VKTFQPNPLVHNGQAMKKGSNPRSRANDLARLHGLVGGDGDFRAVG
jgi:hypothetical protein